MIFGIFEAIVVAAEYYDDDDVLSDDTGQRLICAGRRRLLATRADGISFYMTSADDCRHFRCFAAAISRCFLGGSARGALVDAQRLRLQFRLQPAAARTAATSSACRASGRAIRADDGHYRLCLASWPFVNVGLACAASDFAPRLHVSHFTYGHDYVTAAARLAAAGRMSRQWRRVSRFAQIICYGHAASRMGHSPRLGAWPWLVKSICVNKMTIVYSRL